MMRFSIVDGRPIEGTLVYKRDAFSFDTAPRDEDGHASVLVNDLQLETDGEGLVLYAWGLCPSSSWRPQALQPPASPRVARLRVDEQVLAGTSKRVNPEARWPAYVDEAHDVVCIGEPTSRGNAIVFAPGCVAVIADGLLLALWLEPRREGAGADTRAVDDEPTRD
jgi:hypothetical protein